MGNSPEIIHFETWAWSWSWTWKALWTRGLFVWLLVFFCTYIYQHLIFHTSLENFCVVKVTKVLFNFLNMATGQFMCPLFPCIQTLVADVSIIARVSPC